MRFTSKTIRRLTFHGPTIRTRISWLIDLLGEPTGSSDYGLDEMMWRLETDTGEPFCLYKYHGSRPCRRRTRLVFQILAEHARTARQAQTELEETLKSRREAFRRSSSVPRRQGQADPTKAHR